MCIAFFLCQCLSLDSFSTPLFTRLSRWRRLFSFPSLFSSSVSPISVFLCCPARCMCICTCLYVCVCVFVCICVCVCKFRDLESGSSKTGKVVNEVWEGQSQEKLLWRLQEIVTRKSFVIQIEPSHGWFPPTFPQDNWRLTALTGKAND